ncbi:iron-siderophore ABC transporter substrate-binding protein [Bacillus horti]|uniref:Iron complex transport system substrate-binding protein n=1 Tax=Caldalkalibacillus horti TaxID=77523 RepID=A0ABT9W236_9BACI|nr:iron-siderophore ABC transporter substrate-binding protein [Bacillus horti]MDQ0167309.1 iron complex transport system substrate-binding protein [Bacillus horti]
MRNQKQLFKGLLIIAAIIVFLVGCSSPSSNDETPTTIANENETETENNDTTNTETTDSQEVEEVDYPIVIEHAFGETVIESKPERIATIQWANHDVALALGVVPVGFSAANFGVEDDSGLLPWTAAKLDELGVTEPNIYQDTDGLDFEAIADSNPDVILAAYSGITQEDYDILVQIAPVVPYTNTPWVTTWREQIMLNAKGMGMEAEGEELIATTENLIQEKASEYPEMEGKKVVWVNFSANDMSRLHLYTPVDPRVSFLNELGMVNPESVTEQIEDENSYSLRLSAENADVLNDADILIGYGDESLYEAVKADPLLGQIPAIQRGSVVFIGNGTSLAASGTPNPLSIAYTIDDYLELIGESISKINE